jgi:hypothetical protein
MAFCITISACDSLFKPGWTTDRGTGLQSWYGNSAGLLRGWYARGCVFSKRLICGARSRASSVWVSSNPACRTWDRTKNIYEILGDEAGSAGHRFHRCAAGPQREPSQGVRSNDSRGAGAVGHLRSRHYGELLFVAELVGCVGGGDREHRRWDFPGSFSAFPRNCCCQTITAKI